MKWFNSSKRAALKQTLRSTWKRIKELIKQISDQESTKEESLQDLIGSLSNSGLAPLLEAIQAATLSERRAILNNRELMEFIRNSCGDAATIIMSALLEGSQTWVNPTDNDFFRYFVIDGKTLILPQTASMNCWESIMYASYLAGEIDVQYIQEFYSDVLSELDPNAAVWDALGFDDSLPKYPAETPLAGQLIFYYEPGDAYPYHVALSLGGDVAMSLWTEPNHVNSVQRIHIKDLRGQVHIHDRPW